jgi:hypothetical protein
LRGGEFTADIFKRVLEDDDDIFILETFAPLYAQKGYVCFCTTHKKK